MAWISISTFSHWWGSHKNMHPAEQSGREGGGGWLPFPSLRIRPWHPKHCAYHTKVDKDWWSDGERGPRRGGAQWTPGTQSGRGWFYNRREEEAKMIKHIFSNLFVIDFQIHLMNDICSWFQWQAALGKKDIIQRMLKSIFSFFSFVKKKSLWFMGG